ncbi:hypothetical protein BGX27_002096 [Mortierella sp. AM989]|nr:hypothetical protein BGX27_002096 [Mortierella sp. AM989]
MRIEGLRTGEYGNPPQFERWWRQTLVFSLGLVVMKIIVPFLFTFGEWFLGWTLQNEKLQIVIVMLILPLSMNICQFWVIDYILKQKTTEKFPIRIDEDEEDMYGLVGGLEQNYEEDGDDIDDHMDDHGSRGDHERTSLQSLTERSELEHEDTASTHGDSEFAQFVSVPSRRL